MMFRAWLVEDEDHPYPHETAVLHRLERSSPLEQIQIDISLHDPAPGRFSKPDEHSLSTDNRYKHLLADILQGHVNDDSIIAAVEKKVLHNRAEHNKYLSQPPNSNTGSHIWHRAWLGVYDGWLSLLTQHRGKHA
jgi:hypothetical protein